MIPRITAVALLFVVFAGSADAVVLCARPKKDGTFSTTVKIREVCRLHETQLDPGALGLQGPPGSPGPSGVSQGYTKAVNFNTVGSMSVGFSETIVLQMDLPPGSFVVDGKVELVNSSGSDAQLYCRIDDNNFNFDGTASQQVENNTARSLHPTATIQLFAPGSVTLKCAIGSGFIGQTVLTRNFAKLTAVQLDDITTQP